MISACIITKNEEKNLASCLESIRHFVDEIVINDTGSSDNTLQIAKSYSCVIIQNEWKEDFALARNQALKKASHKFILSIDADEILDNGYEIKKVIANATDSIGGFLVDIISSNSNKQHIFKSVRLFRNAGFNFSGVIHEQIIDSILTNNFKINNSSLRIIHKGYNVDNNEFINKQLRNLKILNFALIKEPNNSYYLYNKSKTEFALSKHHSALISIDLAIKHELNNKHIAEYLKLKSKIYFALKDFNNAYINILDAVKLNKTDIETNFIVAELEYARKSFILSIKYYNYIIENYNNNENYISGNMIIPLNQIYFKLGKCYVNIKKYDEAIISYKQSLAINDNEEYALVGLSHLYFKLNDYVKSLYYINKALEIKQSPKMISFKDKLLSIAPNLLNLNDITSTSLSIAMIVKDEENNLKGALESIKDLANEIVIIDTGSKDKTLDIAKNYNCKIGFYQWNDDFSSARNESIKLCTSKWILYLDADERLEPSSMNIIKHLINSASEFIGAFYCILESPHTTKDGSSEVHRGAYPRLFKNLGYPTIHFTGKIHEQISPSITKAGYKIEKSNIKITHLGYNQDLQTLENKAQRNYKLIMNQINEDPQNGYLWYQLGQTLGRLKLIEESIEALKFSINCGVSDSIYASATAALSQYYGNMGNYNDALFWATKTLEVIPNQLYGLNLMAYSLLFLKRYDESAFYFKKAIEVKQSENRFPETGFDIEISLDTIEKGLEKAINKSI